MGVFNGASVIAECPLQLFKGGLKGWVLNSCTIR